MGQVPFSEDGRMLTDLEEIRNRRYNLPMTFVDSNTTFYDVLKFVEFKARHRMAVFESTKNGRRYNMFLADLEKILEEHLVLPFGTPGRWGFVFRTNSWGIRMIIE